jgi:SAM-dependent methyltransferase
VRLLKAELLIKTGEVDYADWNYRPFLGWIQRLRFKLVISFLNEVKCHRLLEVGYGSGIFMPELDRYCEELHGVDIHNKDQDIQNILEQVGIKTKLYSASIESTIFPSNFFDYVVAVSALEFVHNINAACKEIRRILKPEGFLIVITPGYSRIYDLSLKILTGESAKQDYGDRRELLLPILLEDFSIIQSLTFPPVIGRIVPLYNGLKLRPIQTQSPE